MESYWAKRPTSEIGRQLLTKLGEQKDSRLLSALASRQARAYQYFYGFDPSGVHCTSQVLRGGDQGELAQVRVNHSRSLVSTLLNLITSNKVVWVPKASNIDSDSIRQCDLAAAVLEYFWSEKAVGTVATEALEEALVFNEGFVLVEWDENAGDDYSVELSPEGEPRLLKTGDVKFTKISSWDVIRDPTKSSWANNTWVIVRRPANKYDLAALHPAQAYSILEQQSDAGLDVTGAPRSGTTDDIWLYTFFHQRTPAMPQGRQLDFLASGDVLQDTDKALQYETIPLYRMAAGEMTGSGYGYTPVSDTLGIQEVLDSLHTAVASNQTTFATQSIVLEEGSEISPHHIGGMRAIYIKPQAKPPQALQLTQTPPEVFNYLKQLKADQQQMLGLNDVVRGEPPGADMSGSAMALLDTAALRQSSVMQGNWLRFVQGLGQCLLYIIRKNAQAPLKIALVGKGNASLVEEGEFTGKSLDRIKKVLVETGNPLAQTPAGRFEMAKELLTLMGPDRLSLESLITVIQTGQLKPVTSSLTSELLLIRSENERLLRGENPSVVILDDHALHIKEHRSVLSSLQVRDNPDIVQAVLEHIDLHEAQYNAAPPGLLILTGQQPPPQFGPPPGPGGPGGPPGPDAPPDPGGPANPGAPNVAGARQPKPPDLPRDPRTGQQHDPTAIGQPGPAAMMP